MSDHAYIGRQPILDNHKNIVGHELLYRHDAKASIARISNEFEACASIVASTLTDVGTGRLLGDGLAFVNITPNLLDSELLELLPRERTVLELGVGDGEAADLPCYLRRLNGKGYGIALEDVLPTRHNLPLLEAADYIKLDVQRFDAKTLAKAISHYRHYPLKLVAKKVETMKEYLACVELGFDLFQGYHFARPKTLSAKVINPTQATVLDLLNKVRANAELKELEATFKQNMALAFKLLRYINSAGFAMNAKVNSIGHALTILGYRQMYRWLTLLLITANQETAAPALIQTAMARGRFMELLGRNYLEGRDYDNLFIVGVFSLLDAILEMPMNRVLENLNLPENIIDALQHRKGVYAPFLNLVEASECLDWDSIDAISRTLLLSPEKVNHAHLDALAWAEQLAVR